MKRLAMIATLAIVFASCEEDPKNPQVSGQWHLINISGGLAGVNSSFEPGTISWTFSNSTLTVQNTNADHSLVDGFESGNYSYSVEQSDTNRSLLVDDVNLGTITEGNDSLVIDQRAVDGLQYTLIKF